MRFRDLLICFAAGSLGGLANALIVWLFGDYGITASAGVSIAPALTKGLLYPKLVWGGIWGLIFLLPILNSRPWQKGSLLSLFPTLVQLLVVFPMMTPHGFFGLKLGLLTPLFVLFFNWCWGIVTAVAIRMAR